MRFALRNQQKIEAAYNVDYLSRIIDSLTKHFIENEEIEEFETDGDSLAYILVEDIGHTVNLFSFYVIRKTFDVYHLAFKEAIG